MFTRKSGKPIKAVREAWIWAKETALENKQLPNPDIRPYDLRRTAITRWTTLGIPRDIVMACSGHKPSGIHDSYINFSDQQLVDAFQKAGLMGPEPKKAGVRGVRAARL